MEREIQCNFCHKSFKGYTLTRHKRGHIKGKSFKCDICEELFSRNTHLILHKRSHTGENHSNVDFVSFHLLVAVT